MQPGRRARTRVADLAASPGPVRVCGFAEHVDAERQPAEVVLAEPSGRVALVCPPGGPGDVAADLQPGSAIEAVGTVHHADGDAEPDAVHVVVAELTVPGPARQRPAVDERSPQDQRLDWRHLDLRRDRNRLIFEVQTTATAAIREFCLQHGCLELHSPKLRHVPNKAGDLFAVDYFDQPAYLVQSPQFYKQMAMAAGFERVLEIGPAFRAEPAVSGRHATEFTSVDVELAWIDSDADVMAFEEALLTHVLAAVADEHGQRIEACFGVPVRVPATPFPRVPLPEARRLAGADGAGDGADADLDAHQEAALARHVARAEGHEFVFVTHYPAATRPFFHMRCDDQPPATRSFDLLWKGLEITSGAQREHRHDHLVAQAREHDVPFELINHFLAYFVAGCPPHGGFGIGLGRLLMCLLGLDDLREVTYLFRGRDRLTP